jgi:hypothetical protein
VYIADAELRLRPREDLDDRVAHRAALAAAVGCDTPSR